MSPDSGTRGPPGSGSGDPRNDKTLRAPSPEHRSPAFPSARSGRVAGGSEPSRLVTRMKFGAQRRGALAPVISTVWWAGRGWRPRRHQRPRWRRRLVDRWPAPSDGERLRRAASICCAMKKPTITRARSARHFTCRSSPVTVCALPMFPIGRSKTLTYPSQATPSMPRAFELERRTYLKPADAMTRLPQTCRGHRRHSAMAIVQYTWRIRLPLPNTRCRPATMAPFRARSCAGPQRNAWLHDARAPRSARAEPHREA